MNQLESFFAKHHRLIVFLLLILVITGIFIFIWLYKPSGYSQDTKNNQNYSNNSASETNEEINPTKDVDTAINPTQRIKEANDRRALSNLRVVATGVQTCITKGFSDGKTSREVYSISNGCADENYLTFQGYLSPNQVYDDIYYLTDSQQTKICIYSLNGTGNGIVSFDSGKGIVTQVGKGSTSCSPDQF